MPAEHVSQDCAATTIAKAYRRYRARLCARQRQLTHVLDASVLALVGPATLIQSWLRGCKVREKRWLPVLRDQARICTERRGAAVVLQACYRRHLALMALRRELHKRDVELLSRVFQGFVGRREMRRLRKIHERSKNVSFCNSSTNVWPGDGSKTNLTAHSSSGRFLRSRRKSMVPVGYRPATSIHDFERRQAQLRAMVENRMAAKLQRYWREHFRDVRLRAHNMRMEVLVLLNTMAVIIQRWWRTISVAKVKRICAKKPDVENVFKGVRTALQKGELLACRENRKAQLVGVWASVSGAGTKSEKPRKEKTLEIASSEVLRPHNTYHTRLNPERSLKGRYEGSDAHQGSMPPWCKSPHLEMPFWYSEPRNPPSRLKLK